MGLLPTLAALAGGQFFSRRMTTEGWPTLERLLRSGAAQRLELSGGVDRRVDCEGAPGALRRVRVAVLRCVADMGGNGGSSAALRGCVLAAGRAGVGMLDVADVASEAAEVRRVQS